MSHLRNDARKNLTAISKETSIPVSTLFIWLKRFENRVIRKHTALLDFSKLGFNNIAKIMLKVDKQCKNEIGTYLSNAPAINSVCKITNGYDFMVEGIFRDIHDLEEFLEKLDDRFKIKKRDVYYVLEDMMREEFLTNRNLIPLIPGISV